MCGANPRLINFAHLDSRRRLSVVQVESIVSAYALALTVPHLLLTTTNNHCHHRHLLSDGIRKSLLTSSPHKRS